MPLHSAQALKSAPSLKAAGAHFLEAALQEGLVR